MANKINKRCSRYEVRLVRTGSEIYQIEKNADTQLRSASAACRIVCEIAEANFRDRPSEAFAILTLDTKLKPIGFHIITVGLLDSSLVHPREVFQPAILNNASAVVLIHNHPSGDLEPSYMDIQITNRLAEAGNLLGIRVVDHIIVGVDSQDEFQALSMAEKGLIKS
jgi:DNA repair protein RadC